MPRRPRTALRTCLPAAWQSQPREVELRGPDIGGIAVHVASRVAGLAGPGEVLVSRTVKDLTAGSGLAYEDRGEYVLQGIDEPWQLYAAVT